MRLVGSYSWAERMAHDAMADHFNFAYVPGALAPREDAATAGRLRPSAAPVDTAAPVLNGIDVLAKNKFAQLKGLKLGLITNHTGQDRARNATIDLLHKAPGVSLVALFSPEHGIRGVAEGRARLVGICRSRSAAGLAQGPRHPHRHLGNRG